MDMDRNNKTKIICIGAGASGLFFSLNCADEDHEVLLIDSNAKVGRKMYISGKGRCNITNDCDAKTFIANVVRNPKFLYSAIYGFTPADTIAYFNSHDCPLKTERGKRVFPVSDKSADIIDCLFRECKKAGVKIRFEEKVKEIKKDGDVFAVESDGSTGDGYRFAKNFGHTIIDLKSALCPMKVKEKIPASLLKLTMKNVSLTAGNERFHKTLFGDLEFLPGAITGPVVLSMSSLINRKKDVTLSLDLKPALDEEKLDKRLLREIEKEPRKDVAYLISTLLPKEFCPFFIEHAGIDETTNLSVLSKAQRLDLIKKLKAFPLTFVSLEEIDKGIVTSGGVDVNEVDPKSMESKLCKGLYFIGEVLDVDAFTGGFNLQSALSTGYACAKAIKKA